MYIRDPNSRNQSARPNPPDNYGGTAFRGSEANNQPAQTELPPGMLDEERLDVTKDPIPGHALRPNFMREPAPRGTEAPGTQPDENVTPGTGQDMTPENLQGTTPGAQDITPGTGQSVTPGAVQGTTPDARPNYRRPMTGNGQGNINMLPGTVRSGMNMSPGTGQGGAPGGSFGNNSTLRRSLRGTVDNQPNGIPKMMPPSAGPLRPENISKPINETSPREPAHDNAESTPTVTISKEPKNPLKSLFSSIIPPMGKHSDKNEFGFEELLILGLILLLSQNESEGDNDILLILALLLFFQ